MQNSLNPSVAYDLVAARRAQLERDAAMSRIARDFASGTRRLAGTQEHKARRLALTPRIACATAFTVACATSALLH